MSPQPPAYQPQFSLWVRQLLTVLLLIAGVYTLTLIAPVLSMLTIAFLIAFVMFVPSRAIARRTPLPYALTVVLLYVLMITLFVIVMLLVTPSLIAGINSLLASLQRGYNDLLMSVSSLRPADAVVTIFGLQVNLADVVRTVQSLLPPGSQSLNAFIPSQLINSMPRGQSVTLNDLFSQILPLFGPVSQTLTSAIGAVTSFLGSFLLALFISFLVLLDIPRTENAIARGVPAPYHREFALLLQRLTHVWNGFFKGQVLIGFAIGVLTWIQLSLMGIPNTLILAVITGAISLIPTIGGILALIPLGLIPLIQGSQTLPQVPYAVMAVLVVVFNLIISQVIWNLIAPKVLGDALDLPLPVIIVGVFIGAAAGGVLGAFLVAPIMASLRVIGLYVWHKINLEDPFPDEEAPFDWGNDPFAYQGQLRWTLRLPPLPTSFRTSAKPDETGHGRI